MTARPVTHSTFSLERTFDVPPARVFQAFANPEAKSRWFVGPPGMKSERKAFEFRVGGREQVITAAEGGIKHVFNCEYQDIVPNERIIYTYEMLLDESRMSVSIATIEIRPAGKGSQLTLTEMGAFLNGPEDAAGREQGTKALLEQLAASLR